MFVLGITGGIGCGKSTAASYFREKGAAVFDADFCSHKLTETGGKALPEIVSAFGEDLIDAYGKMDRKKMSEIVFSDKKKLDVLSGIIHREVLSEMETMIESERKRNTDLCVLDVPIPVKKGFVDRCDYVLCIWADTKLRIERLKWRGIEPGEAERRIKMQMSLEEYQALSDKTIFNNGTEAELYKALDRFSDTELMSRGIRI